MADEPMNMIGFFIKLILFYSVLGRKLERWKKIN